MSSLFFLRHNFTICNVMAMCFLSLVFCSKSGCLAPASKLHTRMASHSRIWLREELWAWANKNGLLSATRAAPWNSTRIEIQHSTSSFRRIGTVLPFFPVKSMRVNELHSTRSVSERHSVKTSITRSLALRIIYQLYFLNLSWSPYVKQDNISQSNLIESKPGSFVIRCESWNPCFLKLADTLMTLLLQLCWKLHDILSQRESFCLVLLHLSDHPVGRRHELRSCIFQNLLIPQPSSLAGYLHSRGPQSFHNLSVDITLKKRIRKQLSVKSNTTNNLIKEIF